MNPNESFAAYAARLRDFIQRAAPVGGAHAGLPAEFNALALELFGLQSAHNPVYRQWCESRGVILASVKDWTQIPAMPTVAFKELEVTSLVAEERTAVFHSSGTTEQRPSRHFHNAESLAVYEASLLPWYRAHLLPENASPMQHLFLTPPPTHAVNSSLAHMFGTIRRELAAADSLFCGSIDGEGARVLDHEIVFRALNEAVAANRPVALLGTAFSFVHWLDYAAEKGVKLRFPAGSRVLETGGYKGRSRTMPKAELHALITKFLGVPPNEIICEYGMSELSSQAYDRVAGSAATGRRFRFPPWARVQIISPETGRAVGDGETGLIRIVDLANVRSVMAIQTEDLGVAYAEGFELIGRTTQAEARGCSLMAS